MSELISKTVHELAELLRRKKVSSVELTKEYLSVIRKCDGKLNSYITICDEQALRTAKEADKRLSSGVNLNPLTGMPIALKDIFVTKDIRTTCASKILENYCPPYDGTVVKKLKDAGAVMLGKLNMDEFAMGSSNEYSAFGPVKNPWNLECTPGGSSGGSAAAVAGGLAPAALGTDTGGSVRQPASFCGVVGMKPTYGRVSRYGIIAFASSLDQVGPITRDVRDLSLVLGAIAGHDVLDSTSINAPVPDYASMLEAPVKGKRIGIPKEYFAEGCDAEIEAAVKNAAKRLEKQGAKPMDISLPHTKFAIPCYYIIAPAEASSNLAKYDGMRFGARHKGAGDPDTIYTKTRAQNFGDEVALRILVGTYVLSSGYYGAYYLKAQKVRTLIKRDFENAFNSCDVILAPVTPTTAFKLGEKRDDPIKMYLNDIFTIPVNLAGLPAISLPCGISKSGLPIGLQLIGKPLDEGGLLNIAYAYEQLEGWHKKVPVNL